MQEMSELAGMINKLKNKQDTVTEHSIVHERERERERVCGCVCVGVLKRRWESGCKRSPVLVGL